MLFLAVTRDLLAGGSGAAGRCACCLLTCPCFVVQCFAALSLGAGNCGFLAHLRLRLAR